jgi:hypothetical protein
MVAITTTVNAADNGSCECGPTVGITRNDCVNDTITKCSSSYQCTCVEKNPGVNCVEDNGIVNGTSLKCCSGNEVQGYCVPDGINPYEIQETTNKFNVCERLGDQKADCENCMGKDGIGGGVWTALGCIKTTPKDFIADFLTIALGIAGGIALLLMGYGAFLISISAGDPKKADEGKEIITGTIAGLLFIVFSVFLLKLIGIDILGIPGF